MTDAQKQCNNFEELSEHIVRYILDGADAKIVRTPGSKDGGYDIIAECTDGKTTKKVYFECKLRSGNLHLRDIAANVIIAFNEGAIALVVFTNYNYTSQADEHLRKFCNRTVLNIKILIGEEIQNIVRTSNLTIPDDLMRLLAAKKSNRQTQDALLRMDFNAAELYTQLFCRQESPPSANSAFVPDSCAKKLSLARNGLQQGGIVVVAGLIGIGKRTFGEAVLQTLSYTRVHINTALYSTQQQLLLDLFLNIWGISTRELVEDFTPEHIADICDKIGGRFEETQTTDILRRILGDRTVRGVSNEKFNFLVCKYMTDLLRLHRETVNYLFFIEKLEYANEEVSTLLVYFIKRLHDERVPCLIVYDTAEYRGQLSLDLQADFGHLERYFPIELELYSKSEALAFIRHYRPQMSNYIAKMVLERVGTRKSNIALFLDYLEAADISIGDSRRIARELQSLSPNSIPAITGKVMLSYRERCPALFSALFLLQGKIAEDICRQLNIEDDLLNHLVDEGILIYYKEYYMCATPVVQAIVEEWNTAGSPRLMRLAKKILSICNGNGFAGNDVKALLLRHVGQYKQALEYLHKHIELLRAERQFDALIASYRTAINICGEIKDFRLKAEYLIDLLDVLDIKKEILHSAVDALLEELSALLNAHGHLGLPQHYLFARDYIMARQAFKNGLYNTQNGYAALTRQYYDQVMGAEQCDNTGDWLGRLCWLYALNIKENEGNGAALVVFTSAMAHLPDSFALWRGYYSHKACMCLYDDPARAFGYYGDIIDAFGHSDTLCSLPFHEYIDRAMSKFLEGDFLHAEHLANQAVEICEANRVLEELGRALNIQGCSLLYRNDPARAVTLFQESKEMLKGSGYRLYAWRSQLNYIQLASEHAEAPQEALAAELADAYQCFFSLFEGKIQALAGCGRAELIKTREYHAILLFALCMERLSPGTDICGDLHLEHLKKEFCSDLRLLKRNSSKLLQGSPYYRYGRIVMVG